VTGYAKMIGQMSARRQNKTKLKRSSFIFTMAFVTNRTPDYAARNPGYI